MEPREVWAIGVVGPEEMGGAKEVWAIGVVGPEEMGGARSTRGPE